MISQLADALTTAQRDQFAAEGYTTVPDFFSAREVAAMRAELARLVAEGKLRNVATDGDGKTHSTTVANLQICPLSPHSRLFRALKFHDRALAAARALVGDPLLFVLDQIFLKPPRHGAGTSWHQDDGYWHVPDPQRGVGMWTALHDATVANGTMHIVPGSFRTRFPHVRDPGSDHHVHVPTVPADAEVPIELPAGGVLFFNFGILHCTKANRTDRERAGLALHFINADHAPDPLLISRQAVRLTGMQASGGIAEYGERVAGTWAVEVERALATEPSGGRS